MPIATGADSRGKPCSGAKGSFYHKRDEQTAVRRRQESGKKECERQKSSLPELRTYET